MLKLNPSKLEYIFYHLNLHQTIDFTTTIKSRLKYTESPGDEGGNIIFAASDKALDHKNIPHIDDIPVLFPVSKKKLWYSIDEKNNLIFHHDILKSAFYLLSGYQEYNTTKYDDLGRFPYEESIQYQLDIIKKPVVNYYFEIILQGLEEFCSVHHIAFKRKKNFQPCAFMLSHDVDRIDQYHFWEVALKIQEFMGLKPNPYTKRQTLNKKVLDYLLSFLQLKKSANDFWNFEYLRSLEKKYDIRSVFFFLDKEGLHKNSRYNFHEPRIIDLMNTLDQEKCEIGLHGTVQSVDNISYMEKTLNKLQKVSPQNITGSRQHYLKFIHPLTFRILEKAGVHYDSSLGFAQHEGFRNSYCLPFKPYDFEEQRIIDIWEIPLNAMDTTLTSYRKLNPENIRNTVHQMLEEVMKFGGVFTLLWHNCHFDKDKYPGIKALYEELLDQIVNKNPECLTGNEIIQRFRI